MNYHIIYKEYDSYEEEWTTEYQVFYNLDSAKKFLLLVEQTRTMMLVAGPLILLKEEQNEVQVRDNN